MDFRKNKFMKDLFSVLISNGLVLISSIITALIVPKMLGVTNYGYYKIFTLYLGYTSLLHFGFVDGILLSHSSEDYGNIDRMQFRLNTKFFIVFQGAVTIIVTTLALVFMTGIYRFIFVMIGINTISNNLTSYYQYVSQCTMRFKELSIRKILQACFKIALTGILVILYQTNTISEITCYIYISALVGIDIVLILWYLYTYRDITFGKANKFCKYYSNMFRYFRIGIVLTVAFQVANLVYSLDRQFVFLLFDTDTYGVYSFAYSLISIATTVVGAVSLVLFPNLKRKSEDQIIHSFSDNMALISIFVFGAHIGYYPLCGFINWFLPGYAESLQYFRVLFPGLAISSCIITIIFTYYKVLNKNGLYFVISCGILILSAVLNYIAYAIFHTPFSISVVSVFTLMVWYLIGEYYFIKKYKINWIKNFLYILMMMGIFYIVTTVIDIPWLGCLVYAVIFMVLTTIMYKSLFVKHIKQLKTKKNY